MNEKDLEKYNLSFYHFRNRKISPDFFFIIFNVLNNLRHYFGQLSTMRVIVMLLIMKAKYFALGLLISCKKL